MVKQLLTMMIVLGMVLGGIPEMVYASSEIGETITENQANENLDESQEKIQEKS